MGKLYLVVGASSAGKSTIATQIATTIPNFVIVKKATTREVRTESNEDSYFEPKLHDLQTNTQFLIYSTNGNRYGIDVVELERILANGQNALLVLSHRGARQQFEERLGRDQVVEIFIHRDINDAMQKVMVERDSGGAERIIMRRQIYQDLATGLHQPDYIIINNHIDRAIEQFRLIIRNADTPSLRRNYSKARGVVHIVVAATGSLRDVVQYSAFAIPGWGEAYCRKATPTTSEAAANPVPPGWMEHSLFGRFYRLDPAAVIITAKKLGVAFVTFSDVPSARALQKVVEQEPGLAAPIHYLHQDYPQVEAAVLKFPTQEWFPRFEHAISLQKLYEQELILETHPILLVNGEAGALDWCYRQINERPRP